MAIVALVSGCTQPADEPEEDPLFGLCPQWVQGPGGQTTGLLLTANQSQQRRELGPAEPTYDGHAFDLYRLRMERLNVSARLELRAYDATDKQLGIRDYRGDVPRIEPMVVLDNRDVGQEFDVYLSSVRHGSVPAPAPAQVGFTFKGVDGQAADVDYSVTFHYKVCGADV